MKDADFNCLVYLLREMSSQQSTWVAARVFPAAFRFTVRIRSKGHSVDRLRNLKIWPEKRHVLNSSQKEYGCAEYAAKHKAHLCSSLFFGALMDFYGFLSSFMFCRFIYL